MFKFLKKQLSNFIIHDVKDFTGNQSSADHWAAFGKPIPTFFEKLPDSIETLPEIYFPEPPSPIVSIIIPVYNNWRNTYACLQAIRERSGNTLPYEVIIADDGSTDDTTEMLHRIHGIAIIKNEYNLGFLRNCNKAAHKSRGNSSFF